MLPTLAMEPFSRFLEPYLRWTAFGAQWKFFAPEPGPVVVIQWELIDPSGASFEHGRWPDPKDDLFFAERKNARSKIAVLVGSEDRQTDQVMARHLCKDGRAHSVRLFRSVVPTPRLSEIKAGTRRADDLEEWISSNRQTVGHTFCETVRAQSS